MNEIAHTYIRDVAFQMVELGHGPTPNVQHGSSIFRWQFNWIHYQAGSTKKQQQQQRGYANTIHSYRRVSAKQYLI